MFYTKVQESFNPLCGPNFTQFWHLNSLGIVNILPTLCSCELSTDHLPISSCPHSYWMPPFRKFLKIWWTEAKSNNLLTYLLYTDFWVVVPIEPINSGISWIWDICTAFGCFKNFFRPEENTNIFRISSWNVQAYFYTKSFHLEKSP